MPATLLDYDAPTTESRAGAERRVHQRLTADDLRGLVSARVKYGDEVRLIDLSAGGALIEAQSLRPNANVVLELAGVTQTVVVPARTLRVHSLAHLDDAGRHEGAVVFHRPLVLGDLLKAPASTWHRVVARFRDGRILHGYTDDFQPMKRGLTISATPFAGPARLISTSELDAIFFVRDRALAIGGDSPTPGQPLGRRVSLTLPDGEVIEGRTLNYRRDGHGFFVHLSDHPETIRVFVTPWAIRNLRFL